GRSIGLSRGGGPGGGPPGHGETCEQHEKHPSHTVAPSPRRRCSTSFGGATIGPRVSFFRGRLSFLCSLPTAAITSTPSQASGGCGPWLGHGALKLRPANTPLCRHTLAHAKAHSQRCRHLDGGATALPIALRKVAVTGGEQGARDVHWQQQGGLGGQLFNIKIATRFTRGHGAQALAGQRCGAGHRTLYQRRESHSTTPQQR